MKATEAGARREDANGNRPSSPATAADPRPRVIRQATEYGSRRPGLTRAPSSADPATEAGRWIEDGVEGEEE